MPEPKQLGTVNVKKVGKHAIASSAKSVTRQRIDPVKPALARCFGPLFPNTAPVLHFSICMPRAWPFAPSSPQTIHIRGRAMLTALIRWFRSAILGVGRASSLDGVFAAGFRVVGWWTWLALAFGLLSIVGYIDYRGPPGHPP